MIDVYAVAISVVGKDYTFGSTGVDIRTDAWVCLVGAGSEKEAHTRGLARAKREENFPPSRYTGYQTSVVKVNEAVLASVVTRTKREIDAKYLLATPSGRTEYRYLLVRVATDYLSSYAAQPSVMMRPYEAWLDDLSWDVWKRQGRGNDPEHKAYGLYDVDDLVFAREMYGIAFRIVLDKALAIFWADRMRYHETKSIRIFRDRDAAFLQFAPDGDTPLDNGMYQYRLNSRSGVNDGGEWSTGDITAVVTLISETSETMDGEEE